MLSFADARGSNPADERYARCLFCGKEMVVLPNDRRGGSCFDCLALSVPVARPCPGCGGTIPGEERAVGCASCGWYPLRD
ncbi:MAG TPA: hypothetical protein VML53_04180 [Thermoplasmata archaeon]|nr:hypothetical protein [Thermoplasmata archaeon]